MPPPHSLWSRWGEVCGSSCFEPQKIEVPPPSVAPFGVHPLVEQVEAGSEAAAEAQECSRRVAHTTRPTYGQPENAEKSAWRFPWALGAGGFWNGWGSKEEAVSQRGRGEIVPRGPTILSRERPVLSCEPPVLPRAPTVLSRECTVSMESAKIAATRMRETFGLSIFGFDLIVDGATGENMVIDVNYFPSFKDLADFPLVCG